MLKIETYSGKFDDEIIALILSIRNDEAKIGLSLQEQPYSYPDRESILYLLNL